MNREETNLVVIGGGPGGYVAAIKAAQLGAKVTLIEKENMGGTCLNVGCIPTKVLLHAAELVSVHKSASEYGINFGTFEYDWDKVQNKKAKTVNQLVKGVTSLMKANNIEVINGTASFCSPEILLVTLYDGSEMKLTPDKVIIASGSIPVIPPIQGLKESQKWIDSTKALSLDHIPKSMIIIGGGVIGIEMASIYSEFGCEVTIVEAAPQILPLMDEELSMVLRKRMAKNKIKIMTEAMVSLVEDTEDGMRIKYSVKGEEQTLCAEKVLVAVGRRSYTDNLNLDAPGIIHEKYKIVVNNKMETNVPGIYAIGDCIGKTMLAHIASAQGEIAAENAMGKCRYNDEKTNPSCVYTNPEFACVGVTEEKAKEYGYRFNVGRFPLRANGKALIMNNGEGVVKFVAEENSNKILGVHILGPRATDIIGEAALAIGMNATVEDLIAVIHAHPTISEAVREGALATIHEAISIPNN